MSSWAMNWGCIERWPIASQLPRSTGGKTGCHPRLVREWLNAQAASGYMAHDKGSFVLPEEQAMALALEDSPAYMAGGAAVIAALFHDKDKLVAAMRGDGGLAWGTTTRACSAVPSGFPAGLPYVSGR